MSSPSTTKQLDKQLGEALKTEISTDNKQLLQTQQKFKNLSLGPERNEKQIYVEVELHKAQQEEASQTAISTPDNKRLLQAQLEKQLEEVKIQLQNEQLKVKTLEAKENQICLEIKHYKRKVQWYENIVTVQEERIKESSERYKNLEDVQKKNWKDLEEIREDLRKALEREKMLRSMLEKQGDQLRKVADKNQQVTNENSELHARLVQQNNWLENQGDQLRKVADEKQQVIYENSELRARLVQQNNWLELSEKNRPIFPCWNNCATVCFLYICMSKGIPYLCNDLLLKFAVSWSCCLDNNNTLDVDVVKCTKTLTLFEKSQLVHEVFVNHRSVRLYEYEECLKQLFIDDAIILACSREGVTVGHCIVFDNTKESSKFVDVQTKKVLTVEYLNDCCSVRYYKVNIDLVKDLQANDASDPNGHHTCHVANPMPL